MLFLEELHDRQNHSFSNVSNSAMGTDTMSGFSSLTAEQKQLLHVIAVIKVLESESSVLNDVPFNSSKNYL